MPMFPFPLPSLNIQAWNLAAKVRQPFLAVTTTLGRLGFDTVGNPLGRSYNYSGSAPPNIPAVYTDDYFSSIGRHTVPSEFCWIRILGLDSKKVKTDTIPFQFMPRTIGDVKAANYQDIHIIGRSSPFKSYSSSSSRAVSFSLDFFAAPEAGSSDPTPAKIKEYITTLQALVYPIYENFSIAPPPRCIVRVGDQINMIAVCKNVAVSYSSQQIPWTSFRQGNGKYYMFGATVSLTFEEVRDIPVGFYEKLAGADDKGAEDILPPYDYNATDGLPSDFDEGGVEEDVSPTFIDEAGKKFDYGVSEKPITNPGQPGE